MKRLLCLLLLLHTTGFAQGIRRIAVLDFENAGTDKTSDRLGVGLAATMSQALKQVPSLMLVNRSNMDVLMQEFQLGKSGVLNPATAVQKGQALGAQSMVVGTYQIVKGEARLRATILDVETSVEVVSATVVGPAGNISRLEDELARKLIDEIHGSAPALEPKRYAGLDAFRAFSNGVYWLRNNNAKDALAQFDRALSVDHDYPDAQFYRGMALTKLHREEQAIAAFKNVLPNAKPARRVTWSWQAPFAEDSTHGLAAGIDYKGKQRSVLFHERKGSSTIFYLPDVAHHRVDQLELPNQFRARDYALVNDHVTIVSGGTPEHLSMYAVGSDNSRKWTFDLPIVGGQFVLTGLLPDGFYTFDAKGSLTMFDDQTRTQRWVREGVVMDRVRPAFAAGNLMIMKTGNMYRAIRMSDGTDAWTVATNSPPLDIANDRFLVVFEPNARFFVVDLETGKSVFDLAIPQSVSMVNVPTITATMAVKAVMDESTLVVVSAAQEILSVDLSARTLRWKTPPLHKNVASVRVLGGRVYAGTESGELMIFDETKGSVLSTTKLSPRSLSVDYVASDLIVASSDTAMFGVNPSGSKRWEYPSSVPLKSAMVFKGVVVARTSPAQITTLDAKTGEVLWQHVGEATDGIHVSDNQFFVVESNGIKEFNLDLATREDHRPSDKEVLVELAGALRAKGLRDDAVSYIDQVKEIDPDYPPLRLLLGDLATYANLVGRNTPAGRKAIAQLKSEHGLDWESTVEGTLTGKPTPVGNRIINIGQAAGVNARVVALDPADGHTVWRQTSERLLDSVSDGNGRFWYTSGQTSNLAGLVLYQVQVDTGERRELTRWARPFPVNLIAMSYSMDRLFVASISLDIQTSTVHAGFDCFDAASGKALWNHSRDVTMTRVELQLPFGLFMPHGENLIYSIGHEIWAVRSADGVEVDRQHEDLLIGPNWRRGPMPEGPVYFSTDRNDIVAYDEVRREMVHAPGPDIDTPALMIHDGVLFGYDVASVYAYDLKSGEKWRVRGQFVSIVDGDSCLWALRKDNVLVQFDRSSGKVIAEIPTLWKPSAFGILGNHAYIFAADGQVYALKVPEVPSL